MAKVLVIEATSTKAVPPEERYDALRLPASGDAILAALGNMLSVDRWLREQHPAWVAEGYSIPLGQPGCAAWIADVPGRFLRSRRLWDEVEALRARRGQEMLAVAHEKTLPRAAARLSAVAAAATAPTPPRRDRPSFGARV